MRSAVESAHVIQFPGRWVGSRIRENRALRLARWLTIGAGLVLVAFVLAAAGGFAIGAGAYAGACFLIAGLALLATSFFHISRPPQ